MADGTGVRTPTERDGDRLFNTTMTENLRIKRHMQYGSTCTFLFPYYRSNAYRSGKGSGSRAYVRVKLPLLKKSAVVDQQIVRNQFFAELMCG